MAGMALLMMMDQACLSRSFTPQMPEHAIHQKKKSICCTSSMYGEQMCKVMAVVPPFTPGGSSIIPYLVTGPEQDHPLPCLSYYKNACVFSHSACDGRTGPKNFFLLHVTCCFSKIRRLCHLHVLIYRWTAVDAASNP